jgi:RNA polymerase sigma-70 factor (ECF subfamily)
VVEGGGALVGGAGRGAIAALLRDDVRATMPPHPFWFEGRYANMTAMAHGFDPASPSYLGDWRAIATRANRLPAAAFYVRRRGAERYEAFDLTVLRIEDGLVAEMTAFGADVFPAFGLPAEL